MPTILLLAQGPEADRLRPDLESLGHEVVHLEVPVSSPDALDLSETGAGRLDLVAIDVGNPSLSPAPLIRRLRERPETKSAPIVLLVDEEGLSALDFSLDVADFILRPLRLGEVHARLRRLLRDTGFPEGNDVLKARDLAINQSRYEVRVKGVPVDLTLKEYELLKHLVAHKGRVFTRADLLDSIWGYDYYGGMRTVDVHIRRLRSKLGAMGEAINTVRGVGYSFSPP